MNVIENRYFKPWIGKQSNNSDLFGKRVLILGESIYRCEHTNPNRCIELIENNSNGTETHKFYTNIYLGFMGVNAERSFNSKSHFWNNVLFINYVDDVVENGSRTAPADHSIKKAQNEWIDVLSVLEPDRIVVLGKRLWNYLPKPDSEHEISFLAEDKDRHYSVRKYNFSNKSCTASFIYHPSARFSSKFWHPNIEHFLR